MINSTMEHLIPEQMFSTPENPAYGVSAVKAWEDYGEVKAALQSHAADKEPDEGVPRFNEVISRLGGVYPAG